MIIRPKNWESFQHYKNRLPPWIKLHREILNDITFMRLQPASRGLAPFLWLLASESSDGSFDGSLENLAFRLRMEEKDVATALKPLLEKGFFISTDEHASPLLARCLQVATPETERETEGEAEERPAKGKLSVVGREGEPEKFAAGGEPW